MNVANLRTRASVAGVRAQPRARIAAQGVGEHF